MNDWLKIATRRDIVYRGLKVGGIVGTVLTGINQGDVILYGGLSAVVVWKIPLTYLVPYCVSTYAGVSAILSQSNSNDSVDSRSADE